jgi:5-methylcytosine-specific restriction endonuclease McrA
MMRFLRWLLGIKPPRVDYYAYITSLAWKARAAACKARAKWRCEECGARGNGYSLEAHHLHYRTLGHERARDLVCLCADCHNEVAR